MTTLEWRIPFSHEPANAPVAHLIDVSQWLTRRLCRPEIVNSELALPVRIGVRHCAVCRAKAGAE